MRSYEDAERFRVSFIYRVTGAFADVSCEEAADFEVTSEMTGMTDYDIPQEWAAHFADAGFDGIRYTQRFAPGEKSAWAVFGVAGAHTAGTLQSTISGHAACQQVGVRVAPKILTTPSGLTVLKSTRR